MNKRFIYILSFVLPVPVIIISLFIGPSDIASFKSIWLYFFNAEFDSGNASILKAILFDVRLPRVLLAFIVGGALSVSGCSLQAIFRNPLVSPYILGLSSGAAFGAAFALATAFLPVQISAFIFGLLAVAISYLVARKNNYVSIISLILSGIIVNGLFTALLTIVQFLSDPFKLQSIVHWTMGNLHNANWDKLQTSAIPMLIGSLVLILYRWRLNLLALGDDEAKTSGINPEKDKIIILVSATLASSAAVAVAGIIGLYGLIIPHITRMLIGPDNRKAIPVNFFLGGILLLIIDNFSRTISGFEIPIGVFTMLIGAPFFIFLMKKSNIGWEN
jgi:iron complex transport system permease protein